MSADSSQELFGKTPSSDDDNSTIYPSPGWVWDFPQPKGGDENTKYAGRFMLSLVEFVHYVIFVTQLGVAYSYYNVSKCNSLSCASLFLVMMAPVFQGLAGVIPVLMHEYEGWQIAQFENPSADHKKYNNDELRYATYKLLFLFQTVASLMFFVGVFGTDWTIGKVHLNKPWTIVFIVAILIWLYVAPRVTKPLPLYLNGRSLFPVPIAILATFIPINLAYTYALIHILGVKSGLLITVLYLLGGVSEGLGAESTFDQRWHLLAVLFLAAAGIIQIFFVLKTYGLCPVI